MTPLHWIDAFETGDTQIDQQHRAIVQALQELTQLLADRRLDQALPACRGLRALLARHAEFEERRLEEMGFPRVAEHLELHASFRRTVGDLLHECGEQCRRCAEVGCVDRLTEAVVREELIADVDYKSFLEERRSG